jgi:hypothetical protein
MCVYVCNSYVLISIPPLFSSFFASSLSAFLFIYFLLFVQCRIFVFLQYLFVPCLHSRMIFCVPRFLHNRICTMFIYSMFVCRVVHIFLFLFFFFFASVFVYQSHTDRTTTTTTTKNLDLFVCACV